MIDPRISLLARAPDLGQTFNNIQNRLNNRETQQQNTQLFDMKMAQGQQQMQDDRDNRRLRSVAEFSTTDILPNINNPQLLASKLQQRIVMMDNDPNMDSTESREALAQLQSGDIQGLQRDAQASIQLFNMRNGQQQQASAGTREFQNLLNIAQNPNSTQLEKDSANRELGNLARVGSSAGERVATNQTLGSQVAEQKGAEAAATEAAKLGSQLKFKPAINKAVKLAEKAATEKGEVLTDLARMQAGLPGIKQAVSELVELSSIATSTLGGRAFDFAVKESGFGSTKGADARAKLIAIVDNQVLPLLRVTFGAAFTAKEGETLKDSLVNPNSSPSQKKEQLSAFLAQKERDIITKQSQLGIDPNASNEQELDITDPNLTIEQLMAERKRLGGL
jgi:hypothetical protein